MTVLISWQSKDAARAAGARAAGGDRRRTLITTANNTGLMEKTQTDGTRTSLHFYNKNNADRVTSKKNMSYCT